MNISSIYPIKRKQVHKKIILTFAHHQYFLEKTKLIKLQQTKNDEQGIYLHCIGR